VNCGLEILGACRSRGAPKTNKNKKYKGESVGCFYYFYVGLRFFGLFCKTLLRAILTSPARHQHPHDTSNPPVGHWGNCEPKWWPQKQNSEQTRGELNGLVVYGDVRIGLTLYSSSCSTRYEFNLLLGRKKKSAQKKCFAKTPHKWVIRELARKGRPHSQLRVPTCGGLSTDGPQPTQGAPKKKRKKGKSVGCFLGLFFLFLVFWGVFFGRPLLSLHSTPPF
jgi:hypothetical protein